MSDTTGWYEFLKPGVRTTHIAYVHENSPVYLPEGPDVVAEADFLFASAEGQITRLVPEQRVTDERHDWADWIDSATAHVGSLLTVEKIAEALRADDRPFGKAVR